MWEQWLLLKLPSRVGRDLYHQAQSFRRESVGWAKLLASLYPTLLPQLFVMLLGLIRHGGLLADSLSVLP